MSDNDGPDAVEADDASGGTEADEAAIEEAMAEADAEAAAPADDTGDDADGEPSTEGQAETTPDEDAGQVDEPAAADAEGAPAGEGTGEAAAELREENERLRARVEDLEDALEQREERVEDLTSRLKRKQADFQNYKKRAKKRQEQIQERATEDLVERLLTVRDNLKRAIDQDHDDVESIREGVKMTLAEFDRVLDAENVAEISPAPGDEVDPQRHEVLMRVDSGQDEGRIHEVYRPGYEMADKVLQAAQVTVSNGSGASDDGEGEASDGADEAVPLGGEVDDGAADDPAVAGDERTASDDDAGNQEDA